MSNCLQCRVTGSAVVIGLLVTLLCGDLSAQLLLNEVLYDPPGGDTGWEFVELISLAQEPMPLLGLRLEFCNGSTPGEWRPLWSGAAEDTIAPGGLWLLGEADVAGVDSRVTLAMQNGPEALRLVRGDQVLDLLGYGLELPGELFESWPADDPSGRSLARRPDGLDTDQNALDWFVADPTPGRLNFPPFRVKLVGIESQYPPVPPGGTLTMRLTVANTGLATWPSHLEIRCGGELLGTIPPLQPETNGWEAVDLHRLAGGEHLLTVSVGLPDHEPGDSLALPCRTGFGPLMLTEVLFAPEGDEPEWVECQALTEIPGLMSYTLADLSGTAARFRPPPLLPGEYCLLTGHRDALLAVHPHLPAERILELSPWPSLANSGESTQLPGYTDGLRLDDPQGRRSDGIVYRGDWIITKGYSLERVLHYGEPALAPWAVSPQGSSPLTGSPPVDRPLAPGQLLVRPNPFNPEREHQRFTLRAAGTDLTLRIFDAAGRFLQSSTGSLTPGQLELVWDGRDRQGKTLPDGAYPFQMEWLDPGGRWLSRRGVCGLRRGEP